MKGTMKGSIEIWRYIHYE